MRFRRAGRLIPLIWHGYHPIRICCAVRGSTEKQHDRATKWIEALEQRHRGLYPEVA